VYSLHSLQRQWDLHAYFAPTKDLTDREQIEHRRIISKEFPELPARAGRYLSSMRQLCDEAATTCKSNEHLIQPYINSVVAPAREDKTGHKISVAGVAKHEPNLMSFTKTLIQIAQDQVRNEIESDEAA
jgi:hypothetical protein